MLFHALKLTKLLKHTSLTHLDVVTKEAYSHKRQILELFFILDKSSYRNKSALNAYQLIIYKYKFSTTPYALCRLGINSP